MIASGLVGVVLDEFATYDVLVREMLHPSCMLRFSLNHCTYDDNLTFHVLSGERRLASVWVRHQ